MRRRAAARIAAPAAFLAAVTVAVLAVRSGLEDEVGTPVTTAPPPAATTPTTEGTTTTGAETAGRRFYQIQRGDTLAAVADRYDTTVEQLLELNPDVDPVALRVGQRIRVE